MVFYSEYLKKNVNFKEVLYKAVKIYNNLNNHKAKLKIFNKN